MSQNQHSNANRESDRPPVTVVTDTEVFDLWFDPEKAQSYGWVLWEATVRGDLYLDNDVKDLAPGDSILEEVIEDAAEKLPGEVVGFIVERWMLPMFCRKYPDKRIWQKTPDSAEST